MIEGGGGEEGGKGKSVRWNNDSNKKKILGNFFRTTFADGPCLILSRRSRKFWLNH